MRPGLALALLLLAASCARAPIAEASAIVRAFAREQGLPEPEGLEAWRLEVFPDQGSMWAAYQRSIGGDPADRPPRPTTVAVPGRGVILAVNERAFARAAPQVAALRRDAWTRVIAHELAHVFHEQLSGGRTGPRWFAEGLAVVAAGQGIGECAPTRSSAEALEPIDWEDPHAYERAAAAVRYLVTRVPVQELIARAAEPGFEAWIRSAVP